MMIPSLNHTPAPTLKPAPAPTPTETPVPATPQDSLEPGLLRKAAGSVVAAGTGSAGLVYGGVKGLIRGAREIPSTTLKGGQIGTRISEPLTRTAGATLAVALTGVAGVATAAVAVLAPLGGFLAGTVADVAEKGMPAITGATRTAARAGVQVGSAVLGAVGGTLGALVGLCTLPTILYPPFGLKLIPQAVRACASGGATAGSKAGQVVGGAIGATLGAVGGGLGAVAKGLPRGLQTGIQGGQQGIQSVRQFPQVAKDIWNSSQSASKLAAQATGGTVGVVAGAASGLLVTGVEGLGGAIQGAADWGRQGYQAVTGAPTHD